MTKSLILRLVSIGILMGLLLVPLGYIHLVVAERQGLQHQVERSVADSMAGPQRIAGPVLVVPYTERETITEEDDKGREKKRVVEHARTVFFVPERQHIKSHVTIERRQRGIYEALVHQSTIEMRVNFALPARFGIKADAKNITFGLPSAGIGISDVRGLIGTPEITWNGQSANVTNGSPLAALGDGIGIALDGLAGSEGLNAKEPQNIELLVKFKLAGTRSISVAPIGKSTQVEMLSAWPHPSFGGSFLPVQRSVSPTGFSARWEVSHLASKNGGLLTNGIPERKSLETFDVSFIEPVNVYSQAERAVKYGILFIALTFAAFFLFETLKNIRIHPLQYGLVGLALAVFFLLVVSLSEHIAFTWAYLAAACACVVLITYYVMHVLGGWRLGMLFGGMLTLLYAVLYGLLLSEDNALVLGSLLVFTVLAAMMVLTRKVNWYADR